MTYLESPQFIIMIEENCEDDIYNNDDIMF